MNSSVLTCLPLNLRELRSSHYHYHNHSHCLLLISVRVLAHPTHILPQPIEVKEFNIQAGSMIQRITCIVSSETSLDDAYSKAPRTAFNDSREACLRRWRRWVSISVHQIEQGFKAIWFYLPTSILELREKIVLDYFMKDGRGDDTRHFIVFQGWLSTEQGPDGWIGLPEINLWFFI